MRLKLFWVSLGVLLTLVAVGGGDCCAQTLYFEGGLEQAKRVARAQNKMLLLEFHAPWSHKSRWNHEHCLTSPVVSGVLERNFVVMLVDVQSVDGGNLAGEYGVNDYPNMVVLSSYGNPVLRVDRTMEPAELAGALERISGGGSGKVNWEMRDLMSAAQAVEQGSVSAAVLERYVSAFLGDKSVIAATAAGVWPIFENSTITYYNSVSHRFLEHNIRMVRTIVGDEKADVVMAGIYLPKLITYIIGNQTVDSVVIGEIRGAGLATVDYLDSYVELAVARGAGDVGRFLEIIEPMIAGQDDNQWQFSLLMSLDFVAEHGNREQKKVALKQLNSYARSVFSPSKEELIEKLKAELKQ